MQHWPPSAQRDLDRIYPPSTGDVARDYSGGGEPTVGAQRVALVRGFSKQQMETR
jgi:hypothetical protein